MSQNNNRTAVLQKKPFAMGVKGLTSFVDGISNVWTKIELKDTRVIIDGSALLYFLQRNIDSRFGGQYDRVAEAIDHFFECFKAKRVITFVVFDGPTAVLDIKLDTLITRAKETIGRCSNLFKSIANSYELVDHPLTLMVLVQKLQSLKIPFTFCDSEADKEIASLANQWNCPVISNDSDFFIYDIPAGYVPLSHIHYNKNSIHADLFHRQELAQHLGINENMLPLLASLLGNDFIGSEMLSVIGKVFKAIEPTSTKKYSKKSSHIWSISNYLNHYELIDEALESIIGLISSEKKRANIKKALLDSLAEYELINSNLGAYFETGVIHTVLNNIPTYVIDRYRHGKFPVRHFGAMRSSRNILKFQVENIKHVSSNKCSLRLRQIIYGILIPSVKHVKEIDREGPGLKKCKVKPFCDPVGDYGDLPSLNGLSEQDCDIKKLMFSVLESNDAVSSLPSNVQLFAASVRYWILHSDPKVTKECVHTLILQYLVQQSTSTSSYSTRKPTKSLVNPILLHNLAQWQSVMAEALHLNQILLDALPGPDLSRIFNGLTAQIIKEELSKGKPIAAIVNPVNDFESIYSAVTEGLDDSHFYSKRATKSKQKKLKKTRAITVSSASNRFAALELSDGGDGDSGDEDDESDDDDKWQ